MQTTSTDYKLEIKKPSRSFECRITIGNNIYTNDDIVDIILETIQPGEGFSIGNTPSQTLDLTILNKGDIIYSTSQVKVEIGLKIGAAIEYILIGLFNIDDIEKTDYTTKFTCYDNMIRFETPYFSNLGDTPTLQQVVNELATKTGVQFTGSLPAYKVKKLEGFTCREILGYVSSLCGGNALITRDGKFTIVTPKDIDYSITPDNYIDYKREEVKYKVGKVSCKVGDKELNKGSLGIDSMEVKFENPWVTDSILNDIYTKLNGFEYLGYTMKWQGDISLDVGDIVTCTDIKGAVRKIPILSQKFTYNGGLTAEIGAKGETKNKNNFNSSGSGSNKLDRVVTELLIVNEALINKANIQDLEAVSIRTQTIEAKTAAIEVAIIDVAHVSDLTAINANIEKLIAADATMGQAIIGKANIADLTASVGRIEILESSVGDIETLVNGNLTSNNIQSLILTSDKVTVANGFIKNAMIENLNVSKILAGDISTNKFRIKSDNGGIEIVGATQQFKDKNNRVRIQMGQDALGNFNFILRGEDGTTTLIDHTGIKENAIGDDLIKSNMISENAVGGKQIDYNSFTEEFNADTNTNTLKSSKVLLDESGQTLNVVFNILNNTVDGVKTTTESNTTSLNIQQGKISSLISNTTIVKDGVTTQLKDAYNSTVATVDSISSTISSHTTTINDLTGQITGVDTRTNEIKRTLDGTVATVSNHTKSINGLNSTVSTQSSSITQLSNQIALKVSQTDVNKTLLNIPNSISGQNLIPINELFWEQGTIMSSDGTNTTSNARIRTIDKIRVKPNTEYVLIGANQNVQFIIFQYKSDGTYIRNTNWISTDKLIITTSPDTAYIRLLIRHDDTTVILPSEISNVSASFEENFYDKIITVNNKVSIIETDLTGISSRVGSVEQTTTTIDGKVTNIDSRLKDAELKITDHSIISTVTSVINEAKYEAMELAKSMNQGNMLYPDATFTTGTNGITRYNNSAGSLDMSVTRMLKPSDCPTTSTHCLEVKTYGPSTSPGLGGFYFGTASRANAVFIFKMIALIPVGSKVMFASNSYGTGGSAKWLTSNEGTGKWEEYIHKVTCGSSGTFSTTNFFYIDKGTIPLTWRIASATVYDITDTADLTMRVNSAEQKITDDAIVSTVRSSTSYKSDLGAKATSSQIISCINQTAESIKISASKINLTGYVTMTNLSTAGQTIIDGGNIKTNTISLERLKSATNNPIIRLFGKCSLDATAADEVGVGSAVRLKWNAENYIYISTNKTDIYQNGISKYTFNPAGLTVTGADVIINSGFLVIGGKQFRGWGFSSGNKYWLGISGDDTYVRMYNNDVTVANGVAYLGSPSGRYIKVYSTQAADVSSDRRKKTNILAYDEKIETFYDNLKPISYELINGHSGRKHYGFIAQDVEDAMGIAGLDYKDMALLQKAPMDANGEEIDPTTIVDYETDERIVDYEYSLAYTEMISINTHMIQKLRAEITQLKNEISEIKGLG